MELSKEQQLERQKWAIALSKQYKKNIAEFARNMVFNLPDETRTILAAYALDNENIFYEALEDFMEARAKALKNAIDPNQTTLFNINTEEKYG